MFINLHVHSAQGSLLDSILTTEQIVKFAAEHGQQAVAITDHGYMSSFVDQVKCCKKYGIKPIVGNEIQEVDDHLDKNDTKEHSQQRYHLILLAATQEGFYNLLKIVSEACTNGFYKKPRVSIDWIRNNNFGKGIIACTACQAGRLSRQLVAGMQEEALDFYEKLKDTFDDVYCEIQSHSTEEQRQANIKIIEFAYLYDAPLVITTDAHMLSKNDEDAHAMFVEIGEGREVGESYVDCFLQTEEEVRNINQDLASNILEECIEHTVTIADAIDDNIDYGLGKNTIMPVVDIPEGFTDHKEYLRYLVYKDFDAKFAHLPESDKQIRRERIETELPVLFELDFTDQFIMLYMIVNACKERSLPLGYARGSGGGCLCLFMLGVTQIDSVRWDLDFTRFANLGRRGSMADVDLDISKNRRKEIIEISEELFGKENVAPMATFNTLSTKVAIRDIGKVLNEKNDSPYKDQIPYSVRNAVANAIPTVKTLNDLGEEEEKDILLKELISNDTKLQVYYDKFPLWFQYVMKLEGLPKSRGRHASGTLITPLPISHYAPLCLDNEKNPMIQLEMHSAQDTGWDGLSLVKMDYLGLETLDIIDDTLKASNLTWQDVDINHLNIGDNKVFTDVYQKGNTVGIFQFESIEARNMCIEAKVSDIEDCIVINAANRPGTKDQFPDYCLNKLNPGKIEYIHPDLANLFGKTRGVLLYQEQALQLFGYAGFSEETRDVARRAIGKKKKDVMASLKEQLRTGLKEKKWTERQINAVWDLLEKQANYSFNRSHACSYALLSYLTAWLKTYYPVEFMSSFMTAKSNDKAKLNLAIIECERLNVKILPPNINLSDINFRPIPEKREILFGFSAINGIGQSLSNDIIANRNNGKFKSLKDFTDRVQISTSSVVTLIKAGAIPCKDKEKCIITYLKSTQNSREQKPVSTLPTHAVLIQKYGIDVDNYRTGKKINKDSLLDEYNSIRKKEFEAKEAERYNDFVTECKEKYFQNREYWEFETLQSFISEPNPFAEAYEWLPDIKNVENGKQCIIAGIVSKVQKKRTKSGSQYAYINIYGTALVECLVWPNVYYIHRELFEKGNQVVLKCTKEDSQQIINDAKPYSKWISDVKKNRKYLPLFMSKRT